MNELKEELLDRIYYDVKNLIDKRPMINFNVFTDNIQHRNRKYGIYCFFDVYEKIENKLIQINLEYNWSLLDGSFYNLKDSDILEDIVKCIEPLHDKDLQKIYDIGGILNE